MGGFSEKGELLGSIDLRSAFNVHLVLVPAHDGPSSGDLSCLQVLMPSSPYHHPRTHAPLLRLRVGGLISSPLPLPPDLPCLQIRTSRLVYEFRAEERGVLARWREPLEQMLMLQLTSRQQGWLHLLQPEAQSQVRRSLPPSQPISLSPEAGWLGLAGLPQRLY